jgi:hypothetical protein
MNGRPKRINPSKKEWGQDSSRHRSLRIKIKNQKKY